MRTRSVAFTLWIVYMRVYLKFVFCTYCIVATDAEFGALLKPLYTVFFCHKCYVTAQEVSDFISSEARAFPSRSNFVLSPYQNQR